VDLNAGVMYLRDTPGASALLLSALRNMFDGNMGDDGADQGALNKVFRSSLTQNVTQVSLIPCDVFMNGNTFWHQAGIDTSRTALVHATWIVGQEMKKKCLASSGLWAEPRPGGGFECGELGKWTRIPGRVTTNGAGHVTCS